MREYSQNREERDQINEIYTAREIISEVQSSPTRISEIENSLYQVDNCDCPSCLCTSAKWLLPIAPGGIAATAPLLVIAVAADS